MIHPFDQLEKGFTLQADAVVVGSGAGGAVSALNLSRAGMKVALVEAGPQLQEGDMTREAPIFLARYLWEGGTRLAGGNSFHPCMQGRMLGGSTVVNSAIMFALPDYVRRDWAQQDGLSFVESPHMDAAYRRVFKRTNTVKTPASAQGKRNIVIRDVLDGMGLKSAPLPRAVKNCAGCGDCLTGCWDGNKQSVDRSYVAEASARHGCEVFTNCHVERVLTRGNKAVGVAGWVMSQPNGKRRLAKFVIEAPLVIVAAGATHTPVILQKSRTTGGGRAGATLSAHVTGGLFGHMPDLVDPWFGAAQGYGAFSDKVEGLKIESLWAPVSVLFIKSGGFGKGLYDFLPWIKHSAVLASVFRGHATGKVRSGPAGGPSIKLKIPAADVHVVMRSLYEGTISFLEQGAEFVFSGVHGVPDQIRTPEQAQALLSKKINARSYSMTLNHIFASCRMSAHEKAGTVDLTGKVHGVDGLYLSDASIFPGPSAVNPQATIMALADLISRRLGEYKDSDYVNA
jgi:choline dehydrogenase-like flavoprotein